MKKVFYMSCSVRMLGFSGFILFALSTDERKIFLKTIEQINGEAPYVTSLLFSVIEYWWALFTVLAALALVPMIYKKFKTSLLFSFIGLFSVFFAAYANLFVSSTNI